MSTPRLDITKASAGSGKTFKLAYNFIRLLLGYRQPETDRWKLYPPGASSTHRHILAITFTNKATDEMKRRIVSQLATLAGMKVMNGARSKYLDILATDFGLSSADDYQHLKQNSERALRDLLFAYSEFNVSTIDAFLQSVLRSFAYEADLSGNYELSLDNETMIENGIADTIALAISDPKQVELKQWIDEFMSSSLRAGEAYNIFDREGSVRSSLRNFMQSLTKEDFDRKSEKVIKFLDDESGNNVDSLMRNLNERREELVNEMLSLAESMLADPAIGSFNAHFVKFISVATNPDNKTFATYLKQMDQVENLVNKSAKTKPGAALLTEVELFLHDCAQLRTIMSLRSQLYYLGLFNAISQSIRRLKHESNTIMLSDTNTLLRQIIGDNPSPFIFERTGVKLRHFLIDEFQDTSQTQWEIIKPLLVESLSKSFDNLIIGDVKQCIYRFRNSDPSLLASSLQKDPDLTRHIDLHTTGINRRSARHIVEFNYKLFPRLGSLTGNGNVYPVENEKILDNAPDGFVCLECGPVGSFPEFTMQRTFEHICRQLDPNQGKYRPCDIAVLCRKNQEAADITEFLLTKFAETPGLEHVSVMSDESLRISSSKAVKRVIARLKLLDTAPTPSSTDDKDPFYISPARFDWILSEFEERSSTTEGDNNRFTTIASLADEYSGTAFEIPDDPSDETLRSLPLRIEHIIGELPESLREADSVYLFALMDAVIDFCATGTPTLHSFLQWWEITGKNRCITSSPSTDAITVMTIHKAKGLEFDCVHVPFISDKLGREIDLRWYSCNDSSGANLLAEMGVKGPLPDYLPLRSRDELRYSPFASQYLDLLAESRLDDLNLLYVSFTRPVRELIVGILPRSKTDLDDIMKKPMVPDPESDSIYVESLLQWALQTERDTDPSNYGAWIYTSGAPTTRISKPEETDQPAPAPSYMPSYLSPARRPVHVVSKVGEEDKC